MHCFSQPCPAGERFEFITESRLKDTLTILGADTLYTKMVIQGRNYVFRYLKMFGCPDREDDDYREVIRWEVPDTSSTFTITYRSTDPFPQNLTYSRQAPGWPGRRGYHKIVTGTIQGTREGNAWNITGSVQFEVMGRGKNSEGTKVYQFSSVFTEWDQNVKENKKHIKTPKSFFL